MNEPQTLLTYTPLFRRCPLFQGIPEASYLDALRFLRARVQAFPRGALLLRIGDPFHHAGLVLEGTIAGSFQNERFDQITMNQFTAGELFGEAMACAGTLPRSPMQIRAVTDCVILFLDCQALCVPAAPDSPYQAQLAANLIRSFARKNLFLSQKVRILSQKGLRDRILVYLHGLPAAPDGSVTVPFTQTALAEFLGVNRSALSRELGRMAAEGILTTDGKTFHLRG